MGKSAGSARLVAVCAVTAVAGGVLAGAPVSAHAPDAPPSSVATPAAVRGEGVTPRGDVVFTGLKIKVAGVTAGGRASVTVTGPAQRSLAARAAKRYSKVIYRSKTLQVRPGVYWVTSSPVSATGGTDVPKVATKKLRVRKNKLTGFTVSYQFVASTPVPPVVSCAAGDGAFGTCVLGDTGPGGGKVFYVNPTNTPGSNYLEAVTPGMLPAWQDDDFESDYSWCEGAGTGATVTVGTGTAIGSGKANTDLMIAAPALCTGSSAVSYVRNYAGGLGAGTW